MIRGVSDRLTDRLPPAAGLQFGESDTLEISGPGWTRSDATEWMHRTLPGLLDGFVAEEDLPSAQLRAAVHDPNGPVGAQILQNLARPSARRGQPGGPWSDLTEQASEARAREYRAAARSSLPGRGDRLRPGRARRDAEPEPAQHPGHDDAEGWPWSGTTGSADQEPTDDASPTGLVPPGLVTAGWMSGSVNGSADPAGARGSGSDVESAGRHGSGEPSRARQSSEDEAQASRHGAGRRGSRREKEHTPAGSASPHVERTGDDTADKRGSNSSRKGGSNGGHNGSSNGGPNGVVDPGARQAGDGQNADLDRDSDQAGQADRADQGEKTEPTGELGIADLLAGALAAYRKI